MADLTDEELTEYIRDCGHMMNRITVADRAIRMALELQRRRDKERVPSVMRVRELIREAFMAGLDYGDGWLSLPNETVTQSDIDSEADDVAARIADRLAGAQSSQVTDALDDEVRRTLTDLRLREQRSLEAIGHLGPDVRTGIETTIGVLDRLLSAWAPRSSGCPHGTMPRSAGPGHWRDWHRGHGCSMDPDAHVRAAPEQLAEPGLSRDFATPPQPVLTEDEREDLRALCEGLVHDRQESMDRGQHDIADTLRDQHAALAKLLRHHGVIP